MSGQAERLSDTLSSTWRCPTPRILSILAIDTVSSQCYYDLAPKGVSATSNGRRLALFTEGSSLPSDRKKGGLPMVISLSELIQLGILIVGIIGLCRRDNDKKK